MYLPVIIISGKKLSLDGGEDVKNIKESTTNNIHAPRPRRHAHTNPQRFISACPENISQNVKKWSTLVIDNVSVLNVIIKYHDIIMVFTET